MSFAKTMGASRKRAGEPSIDGNISIPSSI
jgi:hypothetical protein